MPIVKLEIGPALEKSFGTAAHQILCRELIAARKAAGLTQEQLAGLLEKPQSFVSDYERGQRRLDLIEFVRIARLLGADAHVILECVEQALSED